MSSLIKTLSLPHILIILDLVLMVDYITIAKPNEIFSHLKQKYHIPFDMIFSNNLFED